MNYYEQISKLFKKRRLELKMMQTEVAEKADISNNFYSNIERGNTKPSVDTLIRICKALQLSIDEIIFEGQIPKNDLYLKTAMRDLDNMLKDKDTKEIENMIHFCNMFSTLLENFKN